LLSIQLLLFFRKALNISKITIADVDPIPFAAISYGS
jgi:hypothetical protein